MKSLIGIAALALLLTVPVSTAEAQAPKAKKKSGFEAAVCACRAVSRGGDQWSSCMKAKGHNAPPGSGSHVSC